MESNQTAITKAMSIHIGKMIKAELERQGRTKVWFAAQINRTEPTCYNIFKSETIDTGILKAICIALNHDFFKDLSQDLTADLPKNSFTIS